MSKITKITVDRDLCIGAASCVAMCPEAFVLDAENKAVIIRKSGAAVSDKTNVTEMNVAGVDDESLLLAAQSCPTRAIFLEDETGVQVYPEL